MKRSVIVDDDAGMRLLLSLFLQDEGWAVVGEAETGEDAVHLVRRLRPDAVVMDYRLPGIDGAVATQRILRSRPEICVIGWSADEGREVAEAFIAAGAKYFVQKGDYDMLRAALGTSTRHA